MHDSLSTRELVLQRPSSMGQNTPYIHGPIFAVDALVLTLGRLFLLVVGVTVTLIVAPERLSEL